MAQKPIKSHFKRRVVQERALVLTARELKDTITKTRNEFREMWVYKKAVWKQWSPEKLQEVLFPIRREMVTKHPDLLAFAAPGEYEEMFYILTDPRCSKKHLEHFYWMAYQKYKVEMGFQTRQEAQENNLKYMNESDALAQFKLFQDYSLGKKVDSIEGGKLRIYGDKSQMSEEEAAAKDAKTFRATRGVMHKLMK